MLKKIGRGEGVVATDWQEIQSVYVLRKYRNESSWLTSPIFTVGLVADVLVLDEEGL